MRQPALIRTGSSLGGGSWTGWSRGAWIGVWSLAGVLALPAGAMAHALDAVVKVWPDKIVIEAGYDDATPAEQARVVIRSAAGTIVAEGECDQRGVCELGPLPPGEYLAEITVTGHRTTVRFDVTTDAVGQYASWRPDRRIGLVMGLTLLLGITAGAWWRQRRRRGNTRPDGSIST